MRIFNLAALVLCLGLGGCNSNSGEIADQDAAKKRDEQRIKDMEKIRDAMKNYFEDKDAYPGKLSLSHLMPLFHPDGTGSKSEPRFPITTLT